MKTDSGLTVKRMVKLAHVSRASYYRFDENSAPAIESDMELRDAIQRIALEWPSYGAFDAHASAAKFDLDRSGRLSDWSRRIFDDSGDTHRHQLR